MPALPSLSGHTLRNLLAALLILSIAISAVLAVSASTAFGTIDFAQYWSAAHLLIHGEPPYDPERLKTVQVLHSKFHAQHNALVQIWNPPTIFPIILPLAAFPYTAAVSLWILLSFAILVVCYQLLHAIYNQQISLALSRKNLLSLALLLSFYPTYLSIHYGQIAPVLLLGVTLYIFLQHRQREFLAGLVLALTTIKPHLFFLLYLLLTLSAVTHRKWRALTGFILGTGCLITVALLLRPTSLSEYYTLISTPPLYWQTPTLGSWLQPYIDPPQLGRYLPSLIAAISFIVWWFVRAQESYTSSLVYLVLPLSLVCSPYGWVYDQMILFPAIMFLTQARDHLFVYLALFTHMGFFLSGNIGQQYFVWYPLVLVTLIALGWSSQKQDIQSFSDH